MIRNQTTNPLSVEGFNFLTTFSCFADQADNMLENVDIQAPLQAILNEKFKIEGEKLDLSGNDFSDWISIQSLCARLSRSDNGKSSIYLDTCSLGRHGAAIVARSFTHVLIRAGNYHAQWLPLMYPNGRIKVLSMSNNKIGPDGAAAVAKMLRVNSGLKELNIRSEGAQYLASALCVNCGLRVLSLCGNELCGLDEFGEGDYDPSGIISLTKTLQANGQLRTLKLSENDLRDEGAKYLAEALGNNCSLIFLDIHGNSLFTVIESVNISNDRDTVDTDKSHNDNAASSASTSSSCNESTTIKKKLLFPPTVTIATDNSERNLKESVIHPAFTSHWAISAKEIIDTGAYALMESLRNNLRLVYLDLSWNELGPRSASLLATVLYNNHILKSLNLCGNPLGDEGIMCLSKGMKVMTTTSTGATATGDCSGKCALTALNLESCCIGSEGMQYFSEVLAGNSNITMLNLSLNHMGSVGAQFLASALKRNDTLKNLRLRHNNIGDIGTTSLASMLTSNTCIAKLSLRNNFVGNDGALALSSALIANTTLKFLDISQHKIPVHTSNQGSSNSSANPTNNNNSHSNSPSGNANHHHHSNSNNNSLSISMSLSSSESVVIGVLGMEEEVNGSGPIGVAGVAAITSMLKVNSTLGLLNIEGHPLPNRCLLDLLNAMNDRRTCTVRADYVWGLAKKFAQVCQAIAAERDLLKGSVLVSWIRLQLVSGVSRGLPDTVNHHHHSSSGGSATPATATAPPSPASKSDLLMPQLSLTLTATSAASPVISRPSSMSVSSRLLQGVFSSKPILSTSSSYCGVSISSTYCRLSAGGSGSGSSNVRVLLFDQWNGILSTATTPVETNINVQQMLLPYAAHLLSREYLGRSPMTVAVLIASSVGLQGQCRSPLQVGLELCTHVRLLLTYGISAEDIVLVLSHGAQFDAAWKGKDPRSAGGIILPLSDKKRRQMNGWSSGNGGDGGNDSEPGSERGLSEAEAELETSPNSSYNSTDPLEKSLKNLSLRSHHRSVSTSSLSSALVDSESSHPPPTANGGSPGTPMTTPSRPTLDRSQSEKLFSSPTSSIGLSGIDEEGSNNGNNRLIEPIYHSPGSGKELEFPYNNNNSQSIAPARGSITGSTMVTPVASKGGGGGLGEASRAPSEEDGSAVGGDKGGPRMETRRRFEEAVRSSIAAAIGWTLTPSTPCLWTPAIHPPSSSSASVAATTAPLSATSPASPISVTAGAILSLHDIEKWMAQRNIAKLKSSEANIPILCDLLLEKCIWPLRASGTKVISLQKLWDTTKTHIHSVSLQAVRSACRKLKRLGEVDVVFRQEVPSPSSSPSSSGSTILTSSSTVGNIATTTTSTSSGRFSYDTSVSSSNSTSSLSPLQLDLCLLEEELEFVLLDTSWLDRYVIGPILSSVVTDFDEMLMQSPRLSDSATGTTSTNTLMGANANNNNNNNNNNNVNNRDSDKKAFDGLISKLLIDVYCQSNDLQRLITPAQIMGVLESRRLGAWIRCGWFCLPSRLTGDKFRWLRHRGIARIPLAQCGGDVKSHESYPLVSAVMGRRVKAMCPYILPPGLFFELQSKLLQQCERGGFQGMKISCWRRGIGIVRDIGYSTGKTTTNASNTGAGAGSVCAMIEQTGLVPGMLWGDVSNNGIDILVWGEGACPITAVQSLLRDTLDLVLEAFLFSVEGVAIEKSVVSTNHHSEGYETSRDNRHVPNGKGSSSSNYVAGSSTSSEGSTKSSNIPIVSKYEASTAKWLEILYLRPGCVLETLALSPSQRLCGEYCGSGSDCHEPDDSPVVVLCDHPQPRLRKGHLKYGYILGESPGRGKGMLRSISGNIERALGSAAPGPETVRYLYGGNSLELVGSMVVVMRGGDALANAGPNIALEMIASE